MFDKNMFTKDDTIKYFMLTYCYTKWWIHDEECEAYFSHGCQKKQTYTDACRVIGLKQFKDTFDGRVCIKNFLSQMTIANRANLEDTAEDPRYVIFRPAVNFITVLLIFAMLVWKSHNNEVLNKDWDQKYTTVTDYSVLLKGLPDAEKIDKFENANIKRILERKLRAEGYQITQINFIYDTEEFLKLKKRFVEEKTKLAKQQYLEERANVNLDENEELVSKSSLGVAMMKNLLTKQQANFDDSHPKGMVGAVVISFLSAANAHAFMKKHKKEASFINCLGAEATRMRLSR